MRRSDRVMWRWPAYAAITFGVAAAVLMLLAHFAIAPMRLAVLAAGISAAAALSMRPTANVWWRREDRQLGVHHETGEQA